MAESHRDEEWHARAPINVPRAGVELFKSRAKGLNPLLVLAATIFGLLVAAWAIYLNHAS
jgi:hypothetical protein